MAKINYREGDWFAVPLRDGGYGIGIVARANPKAALLGYFFGPRRDGVPTVDEVRELRSSDAVLVGMFSHLGLTQAKWPILGRLAEWDRSEWPMPVFVRYEELTDRSFHVTYDQDDPAQLLREDQIIPGTAEQGATDGLMGAGYVVKVLTNLLN